MHSLKNRIKKLEQQTVGKICFCSGNNIAQTVEAINEPKTCQVCDELIEPSILVLEDIEQAKKLKRQVKIYTGFDPSKV